MLKISVTVPTKDRVKDFGTLVSTKGHTPEQTELFDWYGAVHQEELGPLSFGYVYSKYNAEFTVTEFEQHKHSPEILIPLEDDIIVLLGKEQAFSKQALEAADFAAFLVRKGEALIIAKGIWHKAPISLAERTGTMVIFRQGTSENDNIPMDTLQFQQSIKITL